MLTQLAEFLCACPYRNEKSLEEAFLPFLSALGCTYGAGTYLKASSLGLTCTFISLQSLFPEMSFLYPCKKLVFNKYFL